MRNLRTVAIALALAISGPAFASDLASCQIPPEQQAELGCLCVVPITAPVALLDEIRGDVLKTDKANYSPIAPSATLEVGDKVLFSDNGQGVLRAMNCQHAIGPNSTLVIYQLDPGCACAALLEDPKPVKAASHHHGLAVGAAGLLGLAILVHSISP
jgi:hypothetical protein